MSYTEDAEISKIKSRFPEVSSFQVLSPSVIKILLTSPVGLEKKQEIIEFTKKSGFGSVEFQELVLSTSWYGNIDNLSDSQKEEINKAFADFSKVLTKNSIFYHETKLP